MYTIYLLVKCISPSLINTIQLNVHHLLSSLVYFIRRGSRGGEMGEFLPPPPFSALPSFFFFLSLKY